METLNSPISDWKKKRLAILIEFWSSEGFTELIIKGIDRIEQNLPSLNTTKEKDAALELFIWNHNAVMESKYEKDRADSFKKMFDDAFELIDRQWNFINDMSDARQVHEMTIDKLRETLLMNEKPSLN